ncbi:hypothetical protein VTK56DRAFT_8154 [Thermocarpiscus australiensis]
MPSLSLSAAAAAALIINLAHSHMLMNTPTPFSPDRAMTWPLDPPGGQYPYPCQGWTDVAVRTVVTAGATTLVNFTGAAPHGGGSCQFGVNYRGLPAYSADPADWKTVYTIIGGCPAEVRSTAGNLEEAPFFRGYYGARMVPDAVHCGDDKGVDCIRQFEIPIPKGLPNGDATFAWIWYNRITANEVYMMCAPITVTGGVEAGSEEGRRFVDELPAMFLANIKGFANCTTSTSGDHGVFNIPNPGRCGVQLMEPDPAAAGDCPVAPPAQFENPDAPAVKTSPTARPGQGVNATSGAASLTIQTVPHPLATTPSLGTGLSFTTVAVSTAGTSTARSANSEQKTGIPDPARSYPCDREGAIVCITPHFFGVCSWGVAYPSPLDPSLVCKDGKLQRSQV